MSVLCSAIALAIGMEETFAAGRCERDPMPASNLRNQLHWCSAGITLGGIRSAISSGVISSRLVHRQQHG